MNASDLAEYITATIRRLVAEADAATGYREPLVGFVAADDPRFRDLRRVVEPSHWLPQDLLPGTCSVVSFFVPFEPYVARASARHKEQVANDA
jgi:epoxyqueuosine reductase